ncbi:hypothetical protein ACFW04_003727 [Cataglyphis niger]
MNTCDISIHLCLQCIIQYIDYYIIHKSITSEITRTHYCINIIAGITRIQYSCVYVMSIDKILRPLLINSYVCGCRVAELSADIPRWLGFLYILLLWSLYIFFYIYKIIFNVSHYSIVYHICYGVTIFTALLSIILGIYHDKAFKNCIKKLIIVDETLEKLEIITDYNKLRMTTVWLILGLLFMYILIICGKMRLLRNEYNIDSGPLIYLPFMRSFCVYANIIGDLIITSMLGYVGLKFDQVNEYLEKLIKNNDKINRTWKHPLLLCHQSGHAKILRIKDVIWIVIHLHLELRKISRKIDSIFGIQMTLEIGCYFASIALAAREIFKVILTKNYISNNNKMLYITIIVLWLSIDVFRLFLINYTCEKISIKANATGNIINKLSYFNCDVETRENMLQFLLLIQSPIRFCGLGLFQFGFKFFQRFATSVATVLVIVIQAYTHE